MTCNALEIQNASKSFGSLKALDDVSLSIGVGEFFGLLGPNGAGKTTLISAMAGLHHLDSGDIRVLDYSVQKQPLQSRRVLGVVPQELVFDPFFTVRNALRFQSGYFGLRRNDDWIAHIIDKLGLTSKADVNMRGLSGGMKRRVMVAQALVHQPKVIVLDEPTAGVDVELRHSLWSFIQELNHEGRTIILTTHYLEEAEALCNRIAFLKGGRLIALEDKASLLGHAQGSCHHMELSLTGGPLPVIPGIVVDEQNEHSIKISFQEIEQFALFIQICQKHNIHIRSLRQCEPDLEEVFVRIMKEGRAS
jgi:ABC-2 type transport system ATP-binding protein